MAGFSCSHCGRPIAVAASTCPWCGESIMVICAACKAYTDDQEPNCEHCGAPLQPDRMEQIAALAHHPVVAGLARDGERALLVASAVVATNSGHFFRAYEQGAQTVLSRLCGSARDPRVTTAGVIFAAYSYLARKEYCSLEWNGSKKWTELSSTRPWDGQQKCIEKVLSEKAARALNSYQATELMLRQLMNFQPVTVRARTADGSTVRRMPELSATAAIDQAARLTVLPEHDRQEACRATSRLLQEFVKADEERARQLAVETLRLLDSLEST